MKITIIVLLTYFISCQKDVIIVGSGVSGIAAANYLQEKGFNVTILEARNRIGGRLWTDESNFGYKVELGASWIHGENNSIYKLAKDNNVNLFTFDYDSVYYKSTQLTTIDDNRISEESDKFYKFLEKERDNLNSDVPLKTIIDKYYVTLDDISKKYFSFLIFSEIECDFAAPTEELSAKLFDSIDNSKGDDHLIPNGYYNLFKPIIDKLNITLNSAITSISQEAVANKTLVKLRNGKEYISDFVLVTVPLGVLKKGSIEFIPKLSQEKQNAINGIGFGTMEKLFVEFTNNFWGNDNLINIINDPNNILGYAVNYSKLSNKPTLLFLVGANDKHWKELYTADNERFKRYIIDTLTPLFPGEVIQITKLYMTRWKYDEFSYGAYSSFSPTTTLEMIEKFIQKEGRIYFAGEHTSDENPGTINGAYDSGIKAAKKIESSTIILIAYLTLYFVLL